MKGSAYGAGGQPLTLRAEREVVRVAGEVDATSADRLAEALTRAIAKFDVVVADLGAVTFLGSAGLAVLVKVHNEARARGGALRVVATTPAVLVVLSATLLHNVLSVHGSVPEALEAD
ncbi:STAS domain-containing protein [Umezawaea beigongshangensis]|uniref:STAS domain-containing protein n=1 Tax=Umezawaea beigongshangensis TaxID=2780383 RepID=UPI0018F1602B|nr:STAS domain-containing protein [Umezawaea beigongshangensis]